MALRLPDMGWLSPVAALARDASVAAPRRPDVQDNVKRCHARPDAGSSVAGCHRPSPTSTSTLPTPPSAQAQPQISNGLAASIAASGAGATITDCGAIAQTGAVRALVESSSTGSLYQRVVNGPDARSRSSVTRVSHFTLLVP